MYCSPWSAARRRLPIRIVACVLGGLSCVSGANEQEIAESRLRAQLLHETIHGALQVMHRDFFKQDEHHRIPSSSLEDVFKELERSWQVKVRWLAVNAKPMNIDHEPRDAFERKAAKAIGEGEASYDSNDGKVYRFAGAITLGNECLKCHVPDRTSLEDRKAAVTFTMPVRMAAKP
jgi:hypothetical protein